MTTRDTRNANHAYCYHLENRVWTVYTPDYRVPKKNLFVRFIEAYYNALSELFN